MATSSPAKSNSATIDVAASPSVPPSSRSLRGLNKPKCIKCGNVARSRCPYQSCKNCCAKAQNPCHIHVLKGNSSFPDKPPSNNSPLLDQQSSEVSHPGNFQRLRQLSNNFAQFSNLQTPFRSRKPLTKKDAQVINEWRFLKLKEFRDGNIEAESEAFDRYLQNVGLLEEVFLVNSEFDNPIEDEQSAPEGTVNGLKLKLRSNTATTESFRERIQRIVGEGLKKVRKMEPVDEAEDITDTGEHGRSKKVKSLHSDRAIAVSDLNDKLNRAKNEDDLKACWEMASQIFESNSKKSQTEPAESPFCLTKDTKDDSSTNRKPHIFPPRWVNPVTIDENALSRIDAQFSSLLEIEDL